MTWKLEITDLYAFNQIRQQDLDTHRLEKEKLENELRRVKLGLNEAMDILVENQIRDFVVRIAKAMNN